mmetsp:Transcript_117035/g.164506  ORF Transcript_117035/g.164506 Transcript_117035/m.164506 type:complete len:244 (-) Transcript_117035:144-875(-)
MQQHVGEISIDRPCTHKGVPLVTSCYEQGWSALIAPSSSSSSTSSDATSSSGSTTGTTATASTSSRWCTSTATTATSSTATSAATSSSCSSTATTSGTTASTSTGLVATSSLLGFAARFLLSCSVGLLLGSLSSLFSILFSLYLVFRDWFLVTRVGSIQGFLGQGDGNGTYSPFNGLVVQTLNGGLELINNLVGLEFCNLVKTRNTPLDDFGDVHSFCDGLSHSFESDSLEFGPFSLFREQSD